jgi:hypothetical protein
MAFIFTLRNFIHNRKDSNRKWENLNQCNSKNVENCWLSYSTLLT